MSKKLYKNKDWLYEKHVEQGLTNVEIAEMCDVSDSTICRWKNKLGVPSNGHSKPKRVRDKIAKSVSEHLDKNGHPFEGESHTEETKQKMSEKKSGENHHFYGKRRPNFSKKISGSKNPSWKGGLTEEMDFRKSAKWKNFSKNIKDKKNWTCQNCGSHGSTSEIQVHHAIPISDGGDEYENYFFVLCKECHGNKSSFWHNSTILEQIKRAGDVPVQNTTNLGSLR